MKIGIIGLGTMGMPMTRALVVAGHRVIAYDVSASALERAANAGAETVTSSEEVGATAQVVLLSLPTPAHVEAVVAGNDGVLTRPTKDLVVLDTSTVDPETTRRMVVKANAAGVDYLDTPVLGRPDACGAWTFPVGGDPDALERAKPVLEALGRKVIHVGPSGSGNAVKLLNNLMFGAINAIAAETMAACEAVGVSPRTYYETVVDSGAATVSPLFRELGPKILAGDFSPAFTIDLLHKDVSLALAMMKDGGISPDIGDVVLAQIDRARIAGLGQEDTGAIVKQYV